MSILVIGIFYLFPEHENKLNINKEISYIEEENLESIYLIDKYDYVSKIDVSVSNESLLEEVKERINYLIIGNDNLIPEGFKKVIPINTKINDVKFENNILIIDFSKELLNIDLIYEESMIESIIFTLTEINEIDKIKILVDGNELIELPNSRKKLPEILDRSYGINKIYDFDSLSNLTSTIVYYINKEDNNTYYTPVTKINNNEEKDKVTLVIEELKSSVIYQSNLSSYLSASVKLNNYEIDGDKILLSFNDKDILEETKYMISMSLKDNLGVKEVIFVE